MLTSNISVWQFVTMVKTTLYLEEPIVDSLRELAESQGREQSALVQEALRAYIQGYERPSPKGIGAYNSGRSDISERAEELLADRPRPGS